MSKQEALKLAILSIDHSYDIAITLGHKPTNPALVKLREARAVLLDMQVGTYWEAQ